MAEVPQWFTAEILRRLKGVRPGDKPGQFYARCPAHDDHRASLGIRPGTSVSIVYHCQAGCADAKIRQALADRGAPEEYLGIYGTPEYEARRQTRTSSEDWRQVERLRNEMADLKSSLRGLLAADLTLAMLKVRLLAVVEGADVPVDRRGYVAFAMRAGVSQPRAYAAWKADPLAVQAQPECVSGDHVVLTRPDENRQAAQVTEHDGILETRKPLSKREEIPSRNENSRNEKTAMDAALRTLREAGLTGGNEAA